MSDPIRTLVHQLSRLPGIGERTATRLVHHLLRQDRALMHALAHSLVDVAERVHECPRCCLLCATEGPCAVCADLRRDDTLLCVVASIQDQAAIEATGEMRGRYHVLHGTLSPLDGVGPEEIRVQQLLARLGSDDRAVTEVILATPPSVDGEATALYLSRQLAPLGLKVSRIASGVPVGGDLQLADRLTLSRALSLRRVL
ncbi:MAG: recombination protein RecR [Deltaproteobacteria bacterium]|nr:recombination protein RecR [Deltaproteobacteria bacterium]